MTAAELLALAVTFALVVLNTDPLALPRPPRSPNAKGARPC